MRIVNLSHLNIDESINLCIGRKPGFELAREEKRRWLEKRIPSRAGGKLAYFGEQLAGMLEYSPIEHAPFPITGTGLLHVNCMMVLPRYQKLGIGKGLLKSTVLDAKAHGIDGLSTLAFSSGFIMPSTFFQKQGFRIVDRNGLEELMWFDMGASRAPKFSSLVHSPSVAPNLVNIEVLCTAQCPWSIMTKTRIERISKKFSQVKFNSTQVDDKETARKIGDNRKSFLDGRETFLFPPTEEEVQRVLEAETRKLARRSV